jgi:hypothetical protein
MNMFGYINAFITRCTKMYLNKKDVPNELWRIHPFHLQKHRKTELI